MKATIIRGVAIFVAGAATATLAGGLIPPEPITVEQFQERATRLLGEIENLGGYVGTTIDGRVGLFTEPIACVPNPPQPKLPANAVDPRALRKGVAALVTLNEGYIVGESSPVFELSKCKPVQGAAAKG